MSPSQVLSSGRITVPREAVAGFCRKHHIRRLALFGSVLRDDFRDESDVDVLVEFEPSHVPGFFGFFEMEQELGGIVGRKVDLNTPASLSKYFRARVLAEAVPLHDAVRASGTCSTLHARPSASRRENRERISTPTAASS